MRIVQAGDILDALHHTRIGERPGEIELLAIVLDFVVFLQFADINGTKIKIAAGVVFPVTVTGDRAKLRELQIPVDVEYCTLLGILVTGLRIELGFAVIRIQIQQVEISIEVGL